MDSAGTRQFIVTMRAVVVADVRVEATDAHEASRKALETGDDAGELIGVPERRSVAILSVREVET